MSENWLKCEIGDGMFSDEKSVSYDKMSVFVPDNAVDQGAVRVMIFEDRGSTFAVLPSSDRTIIPVRKADLRGK